jgi:hypothetical protein
MMSNVLKRDSKMMLSKLQEKLNEVKEKYGDVYVNGNLSCQVTIDLIEDDVVSTHKLTKILMQPVEFHVRNEK